MAIVNRPTGLFLVLAIILLFLILATVFAWFAAAAIPNNSTSATINTSNGLARSMLWAAFFVGIILIILIILSIVDVSYASRDIGAGMDLTRAKFGTGTILLAGMILLLAIIMVFFLIYGLSMLTTSTTATDTTSPRTWAIVAAVIVFLAILGIFVSWYYYYSFNSEIEAALLAPIINPLTPQVVTPITSPNVGKEQYELYNITPIPGKGTLSTGFIQVKGWKPVVGGVASVNYNYKVEDGIIINPKQGDPGPVEKPATIGL